MGKTTLSIHLAEQLGTEIVSADSRQFFRELTIGTAKPTKEELGRIPHHFIDSHSILEHVSAGVFGREALNKIKSLHDSHAAVVAVGGSGLYLKALWEGFDEMPEVPISIRNQLNRELELHGLNELLEELRTKDLEYYNAVDRNNGQRVIRALEVIRATNKKFSEFRKNEFVDLPYRNLKIGLNRDREELYGRIDQRMDAMIADGLFEEASALFDLRQHNALQTVGYKEIFGFIEGSYDKNEAVRLLKRNSRRYAKRQLTWFSKYDDIHWFQPDQEQEIKNLIVSQLM